MLLLAKVAIPTFLVVLVGFLSRYCSVLTQKKSKVLNYHRLLAQSKNILRPQNTSIQELLTQRAQSNQRLIRALHISNTFVNSDPEVHRSFVAQAQRLLRNAQRQGWRHFQSIAIEAVQWQLSGHESQISFDTFVQNVTLVVVLVGILEVETPVQSFSHKDITLVANRITTLWALSKKTDPIPPQLLEELTTSLRRLVVDAHRFPNPLDFVIPAWETLWRVVATTVAFSYSDEEIRRVFRVFNACPSDDNFRGDEDQVDVSVKGVVNEAMRLHPPSRHIGRSKCWKWWPSFLDWMCPELMWVKEYADVEKLGRCDIWGADPNKFRPEQHHARHIRQEKAEAMSFIFGFGPLKCIASSWAPIAVGTLSGAILDQLDENRYLLYPGPAFGSRGGWNGWLIKKTEN